MGGKLVVSIISLLLVVGVVIGIVVAVHRHNESTSNEKSESQLSSSMKTVNAICAPASFKDACITALGPVAQNESSTPRDFIKAGVNLAVEQINKAYNLTEILMSKVNDTKNPKRTAMAIESCQDLYEIAFERLDAALANVTDAEVFKNKDQVHNLRLWLTDVITATVYCVDEFDEAEATELKKMMQDNVGNATQLTTNVLDIVTTFNDYLAKADLNGLNATAIADLINGAPLSSSRRLLSMEVDADGFPSWLSGENRRLLGEKGSKKKHKNKHKNKHKKPKMKKHKKSKMAKGAAAAGAVSGAVGAVGAIIPGPAPGAKPAPNAVVPDQFKTINAALASYPPGGAPGRFVIYVKAGIYKEDIIITKKQPNVFIYGDGPRQTVITGSKSFKSGYQTSKTAPFNVEGQNFFARDIGFQNTAGPDGHQACAIRINALQSVFQNCWFDGFQDTLYVQGGSQFFRDCEIAGTVDFMFGNGATLIQNCKIVVKKGGAGQQNMVTAQGGVAANEPTGIVVQGGEILADPTYFPVRFQMKTYLGRPWKAYAKTVFMEVMMGDLINPDGYFPWAGTQNLDTCFYGEYLNRGPGSDTSRRLKWKNVRVLTKDEAQRYSAGVFLGGAPWVKAAGVPVNLDVA